MKAVKSLIVFVAFLVMAAVVVDLYFLIDVQVPYKNMGAYIGLGAIAILFIVLIFIPFTERKLKKLAAKIEEKDQEIGRLQKSLEQSNELISIVPNEGEDVSM